MASLNFVCIKLENVSAGILYFDILFIDIHVSSSIIFSSQITLAPIESFNSTEIFKSP